MDNSEQQLREDLAAAFQLAAKFDWHECVGNHFSATLSGDGSRFLLNPKWRHFSSIKASDLIEVTLETGDEMEARDEIDSSAWTIHGAVHKTLPSAKVLLHLHPPYLTALTTLKDPTIKPIDQNTARFYNRVAIDLDYGGMADVADEGARIAGTFGNHQSMIMGNHGVSVVGETVAEAFTEFYYLEKAARTLVLAYSTGQPINEMSDEIAESTAKSWDAYRGMAEPFFTHLKSELDAEGGSYRH